MLQVVKTHNLCNYDIYQTYIFFMRYFRISLIQHPFANSASYRYTNVYYPCTGSLHGVLARGPCKESLHGILAPSPCTQSLHFTSIHNEIIAGWLSLISESINAFFHTIIHHCIVTCCLVYCTNISRLIFPNITKHKHFLISQSILFFFHNKSWWHCYLLRGISQYCTNIITAKNASYFIHTTWTCTCTS